MFKGAFTRDTTSSTTHMCHAAERLAAQHQHLHNRQLFCVSAVSMVPVFQSKLLVGWQFKSKTLLLMTIEVWFNCQIICGWGLVFFLRWWPPSTICAGPLIEIWFNFQIYVQCAEKAISKITFNIRWNLEQLWRSRNTWVVKGNIKGFENNGIWVAW